VDMWLGWGSRGTLENLVGKDLWKRQFRRPWRRWEDIINTNLKYTVRMICGWNKLRIVFNGGFWY